VKGRINVTNIYQKLFIKSYKTSWNVNGELLKRSFVNKNTELQSRKFWKDGYICTSEVTWQNKNMLQ
jgi:hypothetical protein